MEEREQAVMEACTFKELWLKASLEPGLFFPRPPFNFILNFGDCHLASVKDSAAGVCKGETRFFGAPLML